MKYFALLCLLIGPWFTQAQEQVKAQKLDVLQEVQSIWPGAHYLIDVQHQYTARQILQQPPFNPKSPTSPPNLGFTDNQIWIWFTLGELLSSELVLQIGFTHVTQLQAHVFDAMGNAKATLKNVVSVPLSEQILPSEFISLELPEANSGDVVVLQLKSDHALRLPIEIGTHQSFLKQQLPRLSLIFVLLGILLALSIYNGILYVSTRRIYYLFYCLNLTCLQLFFLIDLGFIRYLVPAFHWMSTPQVWATTVCVAFVFAILFASSFLRLSGHYPKWHLWFMGLIAFVVLDVVLVWLDLKEVATALYLLVSACYQISVIWISIIVLRNGYQPARFFLLAWIFLAAGGLIYQLTIVGKLPVNLFTEHAFLIGTVVESLLLSWALAELINKLQTDQIASERRYQSILNKTGNRLAEALKLADKHKKVRDVFLKNISHELKTPLHSIQHVLDLSVHGYQVNSELLHDASHSTRLISRHIDKLLLNTEMGASEPDFKLEKSDVKTTLRLWHQDLSNECKVRGAEFSLNSNLVDWDILTGPIRPVYLLMTEIIFNGANLNCNSMMLTLDVMPDTGQLHLNFNMQSQSKEPVSNIHDLFVSEQDADFVKELIRLLDGKWDVHFQHPVIFVDIYLPFFGVQKKPNSNCLPNRVLVVEDNEINQKVMSSMLTRMGIECDIAINGEDALIKQEAYPADIILMDCQMPVMDGFETTLAIRENERRFNQPIIVAVTANSMELDKTHCISVGMNDFIAKPVRMEELRNVLQRWSNER